MSARACVLVVVAACGFPDLPRLGGADAHTTDATHAIDASADASSGPPACGQPITCPPPTSGNQTFCGQLYDFETSAMFADDSADGSLCTSGATTGPCALGIIAVDSVSGGTITTGPVVIDDCGRYVVPDVDLSQAASPYIGLVVDDALSANMGPGGVTEATLVAAPKVANTTTRLDAYAANATNLWTGGPAISDGIFAEVFFAHATGTALQSGVTATRNSVTDSSAFYFGATDTQRGSADSIVAGQSATSGNGTTLFAGASVSEGLIYGGSGGLQTGCTWGEHPGTNQPFVIFVEEIRPQAIAGMTCNQ